MNASSQRRFLQLPDVAEILDISMSQVLALVRRGDLRAVKIGGRGQWRVEVDELEAYIQRCYAETDALVARQELGGLSEASLGAAERSDLSANQDQR